MPTPQEIEHRFTFHAPDPIRQVMHERVGASIKALAHVLNNLLPEGRQKALVLTHLEDARHWANNAIANATDEQLPKLADIERPVEFGDG